MVTIMVIMVMIMVIMVIIIVIMVIMIIMVIMVIIMVIMIIITITNNIIKFLIFLPHVLKQDQNVISIPSYFLCGPSPSLGPLHHHHPIIIITTITIIVIIITTITIIIIIIITIFSPSLVPLHHHPTYERRQSGNKFQKQKLKPQRLPFHLIRSTHHTLVSCPTI